MTDAIGQTIEAGDVVAYVSRYGSSVHITERTIEEIGDNRLRLNGPRSRMNVLPSSVVKVDKEAL